jgi:solute:Na+ symporter, SSS family
MLLWFVIAYWVISVAIGLWASLRVKNTKDFAIAGRHLPFYMVTATVFATWFGRFLRKACTAWWPIRSVHRCV